MRQPLAIMALALTFLTAPVSADESSLVGLWSSEEEGAGVFRYLPNGQFVWTDGRVVSSGVWLFDPDASTASMILDPMKGIDDQATVSFSADGQRMTLSFHMVGRAIQDPPWVATYQAEEANSE